MTTQFKSISKVLSLFAVLLVVHGYLEIQIQYLEQLDEPTYIDYSKLKVRKVNGTRKIFGNVTIHIPLDNTYLCEVLVYIKQGGQYRLMPYKLPRKGLCDVHNEDKYFYPDLAAASDFPMPFVCPLPPGRYEFRGVEGSLKNVPMAVLKSSDYAAESTISKGGKIYFKYRIYATLINI